MCVVLGSSWVNFVILYIVEESLGIPTGELYSATLLGSRALDAKKKEHYTRIKFLMIKKKTQFPLDMTHTTNSLLDSNNVVYNKIRWPINLCGGSSSPKLLPLKFAREKQ